MQVVTQVAMKAENTWFFYFLMAESFFHRLSSIYRKGFFGRDAEKYHGLNLFLFVRIHFKIYIKTVYSVEGKEKAIHSAGLILLLLMGKLLRNKK